MAEEPPSAPEPLRGGAGLAVGPELPQSSLPADDHLCPHCGQATPPGALAGLCPACLLRQGAAGDTGFSSVVSPPSVEELTELFPQLEILGLIGMGGMGAVYKARQRELDRMVALKILPPGIGDRPGFAERFTREAKALAKLSHPGIVTIHDTGRVHGLYYLLMEFVDGLNLRQLIDRGRVSPREALVIVPMICDALQYAHDEGIVHRDIKPENILLDRQGRVKVADFGLAKLVGADELDLFPTSTTAPFVTQAGQLMGTLEYMAPEQIERPGEVDHRADIYSLGVVLYQMLTGELPDQNLEPPSHKVLLDIRLDEVVLRALEQNPDHRYQQVSQIKQSVETLITSSNSEPPEGDPAMEIKFTCPHCSQILAVDESLAGSQVSCPTCSQTMLLPPLHTAPSLRAPARQVPQTQRFAPGGQVAVTQQARGLAIWSLVLALIGLVPVLGLATGALGLLLGIIALAKGTSNKGMAIAGTVIGGVAVLVIPLHLALLNTSLSAAKFATGSMACANNLNTIGQGIETYRQQNNSTYPPDLETLVREGILRDDDLRCPLHEGGNGYMYSRPAGPQASGLMVWDRFPHRSPGDAVMGRNVVNTELQVSFLPEPQFRGAARAGSSGTAPTGQGSAPVVTQRPDRPRPTTPAPTPPRQEVTVASVIASLASTPPKEQRPLLQFLARETPTPEQRAAVIAAVKPLLNDVDNSEAAFQVFAAWADTDEVPDLIEMVRIAPGSPRGRESMKLLSRLGDARATTVLAASLADRGAARDAKAALAALGAIAKPSVLPLYHHENSFTRETARELLRGYNTTGEEILAESIRTLAEGGVESRRSALFELPKMELSAEKRVEVARAIHPLITDSEPGVRDPARDAMKTLATPADADFLLSLMQSEDQDARKLATELLVAFKDVRAAPPLAVWLADPHETYRAGTHLIALGSMAEPAVIPYLRHEEPLTRQRAADVLAKIGTPASLRALEANANDSNFFAKAAAETAIAAIKGRSPAAFQR